MRTIAKYRLHTLCVSLALTVIAGCGGFDAGAPDVSAHQEAAASPKLPDTEVNNAFIDRPLGWTEAFRLIEQSTFGPRLQDIEKAKLGAGDWIDEQMQLPATYLTATFKRNGRNNWNEHVNAWWRNAITAEDQLRQRVAFALSEILVVSSKDGLGEEREALTNYYDILLRHSFGNYRDLLEDITLSPVMGEYLSMKGNQKPDLENNIRPDENYARELLQLFSIGLVELNPDGTEKIAEDGTPMATYDQATVEAFAHVFTGWHFANAEKFVWTKNKDYINPMVAWPEYHDNGEKHLLNGVILPANQSPEDDLAAALDNIFNHPNVGPFIARQMIQRLVTSNPSPDYVRDVAAVFNRNSAGERGSLGSMIKAILMHHEAREGHLDNPTTFGKLKEPLIRVTQLWRAFQPDGIHRDFDYAWASGELAQAPLGSPSVFNFFRPDFSSPGPVRELGLVSPEFEITDETSIITLTSRLLANSLWQHNHAESTKGSQIRINIDREMQLEADRDALVDHLDRLLLGGRMSADLRQAVHDIMQERDYRGGESARVTEAIFLIISSPEAAIQI